jgi:hypothetical protein
VINNEVNWAERIDLRRITTKSLHGVSHGSEIDDGGNASEILQDDSSGFEWNIDILLGVLNPV